MHTLQRRAGADDLLEIAFDLGALLVDVLQPVPLPQILHESDPSERRKLQDRCSHQHRNAGTVFANQLFFKWRAGAEAQTFFMSQFIQRAYSGGVRSGQCSRPACKSSRVYPTRSRNASLASGIRSNSPETMPAMVDSAGSAGCARGCAATFRLSHGDR